MRPVENVPPPSPDSAMATVAKSCTIGGGLVICEQEPWYRTREFFCRVKLEDGTTTAWLFRATARTSIVYHSPGTRSITRPCRISISDGFNSEDSP